MPGSGDPGGVASRRRALCDERIERGRPALANERKKGGAQLLERGPAVGGGFSSISVRSVPCFGLVDGWCFTRHALLRPDRGARGGDRARCDYLSRAYARYTVPGLVTGRRMDCLGRFWLR